MLQCAAYNFAGLNVCRVFLGAFEGLFGTGIVYYLSLWYHRDEMGVRVFWFLGPTAIAGYDPTPIKSKMTFLMIRLEHLEVLLLLELAILKIKFLLGSFFFSSRHSQGFFWVSFASTGFLTVHSRTLVSRVSTKRLLKPDTIANLLIRPEPSRRSISSGP